MIRGNLRGLPNVSVTSFDGLLVEFARKEKATASSAACAPSPTSSSSSTWR